MERVMSIDLKTPHLQQYFPGINQPQKLKNLFPNPHSLIPIQKNTASNSAQ